MYTRTLIAALCQMAQVINAAEHVVASMQTLRDSCTDDEFEKLLDSDHIGALICACIDLEAELEN